MASARCQPTRLRWRRAIARAVAAGSLMCALACGARTASNGSVLRPISTLPVACERALTAEDVRKLFPDRDVWATTTYGENDPGYEIPTLCAGIQSKHCAVAFSLAEDSRVVAVTVTDPTILFPRDIRVSVRLNDVRARLTHCVAINSDVTGIACDLPDHDNIGLFFTSRLLEADFHDPPTSAQAADARLSEITWQPCSK